MEQFKEDSTQLLKEESASISRDSSAFNCIPQIGSLDSSGFSTEERKIMQETKKILNSPELNISATAVRTPTFNCHCEAVWVTLKKSPEMQEVLTVLVKQKGLQVVRENTLPSQRFVDGWDDVYIGRLRRIDDSQTWMMWVAADNLRKGAALNGLQIAEYIFN